jgi:hypothetical protein
MSQLTQRLRLLLEQRADDPGRDAAIAAAIADPRFPIKDQQGGTLYFAKEHAPEAVVQGLRQRLEAGLELPFRADELLVNLDVTDEGPIVSAILDVSLQDFWTHPRLASPHAGFPFMATNTSELLSASIRRGSCARSEVGTTMGR